MKKSSKITIVSSIIAVIIIIMIVSLVSRKKDSNTNATSSSEDPQKLNSESPGCRHWSLAGDQICHDEANTEECQYDRGDCCDVQNDFTLCSECFCYSSRYMINDTFLHDCTSQSQIHWYLGDGICQIQLNNIENLFILSSI